MANGQVKGGSGYGRDGGNTKGALRSFSWSSGGESVQC